MTRAGPYPIPLLRSVIEFYPMKDHHDSKSVRSQLKQAKFAFPFEFREVVLKLKKENKKLESCSDLRERFCDFVSINIIGDRDFYKDFLKQF